MSKLTATIRIKLGLIALLFSSVVAAQGNVVESNPFTPGQSSSSSNSAPGSDALNLLLEQLRQLQAEVQSLRGQVEQQSFEIRRLQRDSTSRYSNVDQRLQALESGAANSVADAPTTTQQPSSGDTASTAGPGLSTRAIGEPAEPAADALANNNARTTPRANNTGTTTASSRSTSRGTLEPAVLSEQQLYQMAYDSVINSNFERSIAEFDQYLSIYPTGRFVTNAHYWKGQAYLYLDRFNEARDSYEIILDDYPDAAKVPDAMYGLALAYQGLGNIPQARRMLNDIKRRFPNTGVANLADTRLLSLQ